MLNVKFKLHCCLDAEMSGDDPELEASMAVTLGDSNDYARKPIRNRMNIGRVQSEIIKLRVSPRFNYFIVNVLLILGTLT